MEQLDEALGKLLNDPGTMAQVMTLAQSLGAGLAEPSEQEPSGKPDLVQMLSSVRTDDRQATLLRALGAYLSPKRRQKLERAVRLAKLSGLMKAAMDQSETDDGKVI